MPHSLPRKVKSRVRTPTYLAGPYYGQIKQTGGSRMEVILGPESLVFGSKTSSASLPHQMRGLNGRDFTTSAKGKIRGLWVAGHLLNDNLGGCGRSSCNLTPLTHTANMKHKKYETKLKNFVYKSRHLHLQDPDRSFWWGMRYTVTVSPTTFGDFKPYLYAPSHITVKARLVKVDKQTRIATPVTGIQKLKSYEFGPVQIDNEDSHLGY